MKRDTKNEGWVGKSVLDANGVVVGTLAATLDGADGHWPDFALVERADGRAEHADDELVGVPVDRARVEKGSVRLPYLAAAVAAGPTVARDGRRAPDDFAVQMRTHFDGVLPEGARLADAPDAMTISEERLDTTLTTAPTDRVVARRVVVSEEQTVTVVLRREEVRLERVEIDAAEPLPARKGERYFDAPAEETAEWTLYGERPVVTTEVVPVERVRLGKTVVHEQETVAVDLAHEEVELERRGPA